MRILFIRGRNESNIAMISICFLVTCIRDYGISNDMVCEMTG